MVDAAPRFAEIARRAVRAARRARVRRAQRALRLRLPAPRVRARRPQVPGEDAVHRAAVAPALSRHGRPRPRQPDRAPRPGLRGAPPRRCPTPRVLWQFLRIAAEEHGEDVVAVAARQIARQPALPPHLDRARDRRDSGSARRVSLLRRGRGAALHRQEPRDALAGAAALHRHRELDAARAAHRVAAHRRRARRAAARGRAREGARAGLQPPAAPARAAVRLRVRRQAAAARRRRRDRRRYAAFRLRRVALARARHCRRCGGGGRASALPADPGLRCQEERNLPEASARALRRRLRRQGKHPRAPRARRHRPRPPEERRLAAPRRRSAWSRPTQSRDATEVHVLDRWCYLGTASSDAEVAELLEARRPRFDYDHYRILSRHLGKRGVRVVELAA